MCYWLITESGKLISKTSVDHVTRDDMLESGTKHQIDTFNTKLEERLDNKNLLLTALQDSTLHIWMMLMTIMKTQVLY